MCIMCDGASRDEVLFNLHAKVVRHGWALQAVGGDARRADWIYTIGLSSGMAHPELVMLGGPTDQVATALNELALLVRCGERFRPGDEVELSRGPVTLEPVDPVHLAEGLVAMSDDYHQALGGPPRTECVLQLVPRFGAPGWDVPSILLADPTTRIGGSPPISPKRAARRASARGRLPRHRGGRW